MKSKDKKKSTPRGSIANRLSRWVILTMATILLFVFSIVAVSSWAGVMVEANQKAESTLDNAGDHVDKVLITVETAVLNALPSITQNTKNPEIYQDILSRLVSVNDVISGASVSFEPNYFKGRHYFAPYAFDDGFNQSDSLKFMQLGSPEYDYHNMPWYRIPMDTGEPYWSEPYTDKGGGDFPMITYSYPLKDKKGHYFAVVTADVSLNWLTDQLVGVTLTESSYNSVLSREGVFILHPNKDYILNETIFSRAEKESHPEMATIGRKMLAGEWGESRYKSSDGSTMIVFYGPIQKTGWSMAIICPQLEFLGTSYAIAAIVAILLLLGLVAIGLVCHLVMRRITRPLRKIAKSADAIAEGDFHAPLPVIKTKDEIQRLRNSFESMQESLVKQMEELKEVNEAKGRIEAELQIAHGIQEAMLPKTFPPYPNLEEVAIYGMLTPAKDVGGDLYDFCSRNGKLYFCIGDVSGKGIPASLVMAVTRSLFHNMAYQKESPSEILGELNNTISEGNTQNMFVTMFLGVLDLKTGRLRYCNAGHNAPLLLNKQASFLDVKPNLPLGIMGNWAFEEQETLLAEGDSIFLYTDGLSEAEDSQHQLFGEDQILRCCQEICGLKVQEQINRMSSAVAGHVAGAEQSDDLTMLTVRFLG